MQQRVAIFDFDGTLADSLEEVIPVYNGIAGGWGLRPISPEDVGRLRAMKPQEALQAFEVPSWKVPLIVAAVRAGLADRVQLLKPFPGIAAAIRTIRQAGCRCGILSSNSRHNIGEFLRRNGLEEFDLVACGASVFGKAARIQKLIRRAHWGSTEVFYVGDEVRDLEAAVQAGVRSIAVTWGYCDRQVLVAENPDFVVNTPEELVSILVGSIPRAPL